MSGNATPEGLEAKGAVVFYDDRYAHYAFGKDRYRLLLLLSLLGLISSTIWFIVCFMAAVPSSDQSMETSDTSVIFTIMIVFTGLLCLVSWGILYYAFKDKRTRAEKVANAPKTSLNNVWSAYSPFQKHKICTSVMVLTLSIIGMTISQAVFIGSRSQPFNVHYSDYMFDSTGGVTQQLISSIGGTCATLISDRCAITAFDNDLAQSFINVNQLGCVFSIFLFYGFWMQFWCLIWPNGAKHKFERNSVQNLVFSGGKNKIEIEPTHGLLLVGGQSHEKAGKDFSLSMLKASIVITVIVFMVLWVFQLITVSGLYNGLCRGLDKYFVLWITDYSCYLAALVVFGLLTIPLYLKRTLSENLTSWQRHSWGIVLIYWIAIATIIGGTAMKWFINNNAMGVLDIPTSILCRTAGEYRQYNGAKVIECSLWFLSIYMLFDYYFLHRLKISSILVYAPPKGVKGS